MSKIVIGLLGKQGSGKNTFVVCLKKLLPNKKIDHIKSGSGGVLSDLLTIAELPQTRFNLQKMANGLREHFGDDFISEAVGAKIRKSNADIVIFDAVRWKHDVMMIRKFPTSLLVFVDVNKETRYLRVKNRGEKVNEKDLSREDFEKAEIAPTEIEIDSLSFQADYTLDNSGTEDMFLSRIKLFSEKCGLLR